MMSGEQRRKFGPAGLPSAFAAEARVLIVDDEPANTTILERMLRQVGYREVDVLNDATVAVARYEEFRPDIVLLDLHMPGIDGYEILGRIADPDRTGIRPPVVVLTADATRAARERALGLGASDFLTKPLDYLEVLLRIRNHLATRFLELELVGQNAELERVVAERTAGLRESLDNLRRTSAERRRLAAALVSAQEAERMRIAADIHDDAVQSLVVLGMRLELIADRADERTRADLSTMSASVGASLQSLRDLIFRLTPASLEREGLAAAIGESIDSLAVVPGQMISLRTELTAEPRTEVALVLYRIAQEALANARRHSAAGAVDVTLALDGRGVRLTVRDDGRGFTLVGDDLPRRAGHLGLRSMRERAELAGGWLEVNASPGHGTVVTAWVPMEDVPASPGRDGAADG